MNLMEKNIYVVLTNLGSDICENVHVIVGGVNPVMNILYKCCARPGDG